MGYYGGGVGMFGGVVGLIAWLVILADLVLLGVWLWVRIHKDSR